MEACPHLATGSQATYRLRSESPREPAIMNAILESWCTQNCIGSWLITPDEYAVEIFLCADEDIILFILSREYSYMGRPSVAKLI